MAASSRHESYDVLKSIVNPLELIAMVGEREILYDRLMDIVRDRYFEGGNTHYCSLRLELLMAAHDANVEYVVKVGKH